MRRAVVVGGSLAGVHAAETLRERGFEGEVTLLSAETDLPYDRPPLSKEILLGTMEPEQTSLRPAGWYEEMAIDLRLGTAACALDADAQRLALSDGTELEYDGLVLATGSAARRMPCADAVPSMHVVRTLEDVRGLLPELVPGRRLVMIGGGFIGLEVASAAARLGLEVELIEHSYTPLSRLFGGDAGRWYRRLHERNGVHLVCGADVAAFEPTANGIRVVLTDDRTVDGDIVVAGIGADPAVEWLAGSGVDVSNGVTCSPELLTSAPHVVAAGDIAHWHNSVFGQPMRVEHWTNAVEQGRHAAATLLGEREAYSSVPYFWTDQYDTKMRFVGRSRGFTDSRIELMSEEKLVVAFGRDGVLTGALCVGAPRHMARYRAAIHERTPWEESAELVPAP